MDIILIMVRLKGGQERIPFAAVTDLSQAMTKFSDLKQEMQGIEGWGVKMELGIGREPSNPWPEVKL